MPSQCQFMNDECQSILLNTQSVYLKYVYFLRFIHMFLDWNLIAESICTTIFSYQSFKLVNISKCNALSSCYLILSLKCFRSLQPTVVHNPSPNNKQQKQNKLCFFFTHSQPWFFFWNHELQNDRFFFPLTCVNYKSLSWCATNRLISIFFFTELKKTENSESTMFISQRELRVHFENGALRLPFLCKGPAGAGPYEC